MKVHGTSVSIDGDGVLFRGPSGSGKSDLALRMINYGAQLVSDDQVCLTRRNDNIFMSSPPTIRNSMEVRGIGIVNTIAQKEAPLLLVLNMSPNNAASRMPIWQLCTFLDIKVPAVEFAPFEISAHLKVKLAINLARENGIKLDGYE
jgi:serine kinase of HPr protein (carbohydrate metabolism regulator)